MTIRELKLILENHNPDSKVLLYDEMADSYKIIGTSISQYNNLLLEFNRYEQIL